MTAPTAAALHLGVVVGARGELLLFARDATADRFWLERPDGQTIDALRLGVVPGWPLVLARGPEGADVAVPALAFPVPHRRVIRIGWGPDGPEPAIGSVGRAPDGRGVARVDVPGQPGAPLFDGEGRLVGIMLDRRRRRSRVVALKTLAPLLEQVVCE